MSGHNRFHQFLAQKLHRKVTYITLPCFPINSFPNGQFDNTVRKPLSIPPTIQMLISFICNISQSLVASVGLVLEIYWSINYSQIFAPKPPLFKTLLTLYYINCVLNWIAWNSHPYHELKRRKWVISQTAGWLLPEYQIPIQKMFKQQDTRRCTIC